MRKIVSIIFIVAMAGCEPMYLIHDTKGSDIHQKKGNSDILPRFDGLYALCDTTPMLYRPEQRTCEYYTIYSPLIFINNEKIMFTNYAGSLDYDQLTFDYYKDLSFHFEGSIGNYAIGNDTIWAKLPINLYTRGWSLVHYMAYFRGILKNRDTIVDWQIIPPYPKVNMRLNDNLDFLRTPHMLFFMESKELLGLDSLYQQRLLAPKDPKKQYRFPKE